MATGLVLESVAAMSHALPKSAHAVRGNRRRALRRVVLVAAVSASLLGASAPGWAQPPADGDAGGARHWGGGAGPDRNVVAAPSRERQERDDAHAPSSRADDRWWTLGALVGAYATVGGFLYYAWYRDREPHRFALRDEGWFGEDTYAGGADKLGHAFGNYLLMRSSYNVLRGGGFEQGTAGFIAAGAATAMFALVEVKDGYHLAYSVNDQMMNLVGVGIGLALTQWPALDAALDFRLAYLPSRTYRARLREGDLDFVEDYSGMKFLLALHWPALVPGGWAPKSQGARLLSFIDVVLGYQSRGFFPAPTPPETKSRTLFVGLALNLQAVWDWASGYDPERAHFWGHVGHETTELFQLPFTDQPILTPIDERSIR